MLRRVLREQSKVIALLALVLVANVAAYFAVVYPLAARVADADNRAARADRELRDAEREYKAARAMAASKDRAESELRTFYQTILPVDLGAAHRLTYLSLAQLARQSNLRVVRRTAADTPVKASRLDQLKVVLVIEGAYEDMRQFIYNLEKAPEFVIIDDVAIDQGREMMGSLVLTLQLSTYFRAASNDS